MMMKKNSMTEIVGHERRKSVRGQNVRRKRQFWMRKIWISLGRRILSGSVKRVPR
jgi:hypothetical protein